MAKARSSFLCGKLILMVRLCTCPRVHCVQGRVVVNFLMLILFYYFLSVSYREPCVYLAMMSHVCTVQQGTSFFFTFHSSFDEEFVSLVSNPYCPVLAECVTTRLLRWWLTMGLACARLASLAMTHPAPSSPPSWADPGTR